VPRPVRGAATPSSSTSRSAGGAGQTVALYDMDDTDVVAGSVLAA